MQQLNPQHQGWHVAEWGTWGWAETILKLIAVVAGMAAFVRTTSYTTFVVSGNQHLAAIILLAVLTLLSIGQIGIRFVQRETISFIFALLNFLGHLALLIAMLHAPQERTLALIFGIFYVLGQLTKVQFLNVTGYTEGGANSSGMARTTWVIAAIYAIFVVLVLI